MNSKQIENFLQKQADETITQEELAELREALKEQGFTEFDEFKTAKLGFTRGYVDVYVNESGPETTIALPGKWTVDSPAVAEFASSIELIQVVCDEGDFYYLTPEQMTQYEKSIELVENRLVDELLVATID